MPLKMSLFLPISSRCRKMLRKIAARNFSEPFIVNIEKDEILGALAPIMKIEGNTHLIVPLRIRGDLIGGLTLQASGEGRYGEELLELAGCLAEPFAIALASTLAHEEVLRYQAILLDDKRFLNRELHGGAADGSVRFCRARNKRTCRSTPATAARFTRSTWTRQTQYISLRYLNWQ